MLHDYGLHVPTRGSWRVLVLSFDSPNLERMHEVIPDIPLVEAFEATRATSASIAAELERVGAYATGIAPPKRAVDTALVTAAHERGLTVHPYTVNGYREIAIMMSLGVDGIITDYPDRLDEIVRARRLSARHNPAAPGILA